MDVFFIMQTCISREFILVETIFEFIRVQRSKRIEMIEIFKFLWNISMDGRGCVLWKLVNEGNLFSIEKFL